MRTLATVAILIASENAAFAAICVTQKPENELMGMIYLSWMIVPALTASIGLVNWRWSVIATGIASVTSVICWDYLLIARGLFWGASYARTPPAITYAAVGVTIGFVCAGFVRVIVNAVESSTRPANAMKVPVGMRKGAVFGSCCSLVLAIVFFVIGRPALSGRGPHAEAIRNQIDREYALMSAVLLVLGAIGATMLGMLIGRIYRRTEGRVADPTFRRHEQGDYEDREPLP